jgi:protease-4
MKNFLKQITASAIGTLLGLCLFAGVGIGGLLFLVMAAASLNPTPEVEDKSVLVLDLSLEIADNPVVGESFLGGNDNSISLRTVLEAINRASTDDKIVAIYLDSSGASGGTGLANLREIRQALEKFKTQGKKIVAYDVDWSKGDYYLGSIANEIVVNPMGSVEIDGVSVESAFFAGAMAKYGIGVQVVRAGKYKSAVEPFTAQKLSPENRQQTQSLITNIWGELVNTISSSRSLTPAQIQSLADTQGILSAQTAQEQKLVDKVGYLDQVVNDLKELTAADPEADSFNQISIRNYSSSQAQQIKSSGNKIAVVYAQGDIVDGRGSPQQVGGDSLSEEIRQLRNDEAVKAIILRINSPGGSAVASEQILREVQLTKEQKPVVISMGNYAASGGYWIATYGDRIFAEPNTITGSIGVFGLLFNVGELARQNGITWDTVKTNNLADTQTISRPKTPPELAIYQKSVDQVYNQFLAKVAESRNLPRPKVEEIAQGRVWTGKEAQGLGLVDELGGLEAAIAYAAKAADLGDDWQVEENNQDRSLPEQIMELVQTIQLQQPTDPLTREMQKLQTQLTGVRNLNDPRDIYARLPFNLEIK